MGLNLFTGELLFLGIGYTAEDSANKVTSISGASTDVQYPSAKLLYNQLALKAPLASPVFTGSISTPIIKPAADSTTAVKITKADGTTVMVNVNTTDEVVDIGSDTLGADLNVHATLGAETVPALVDGEWTMGAGWVDPIVGGVLEKDSDGTGVTTATNQSVIVIGTMYKITYTLSAITGGNLAITNGGTPGVLRPSSAGTYTQYLTATSTAKLSFTPVGTGTRFIITAVSCVEFTESELYIAGNINAKSLTLPVLAIGSDATYGMAPLTCTTTVGTVSIYGNYIEGSGSMSLRAAGTCSLISTTGTVNMSQGGKMTGGQWYFGAYLNPTAHMEVKVGTAVASTAPFKFTLTGAVLNTTPEVGALEVDSLGNVYITNSSGVRKQIRVEGDSLAEMYIDDNSTASVLETANTPIALRNYITGSLSNWTFDAGSTGAITAYADGTGKVNVSSAGHGRLSGDIISIRGTTNYNGIWEITYIDANTFSILDTWVADDGASDWDQGSHLIAGSGTAGIYKLSWNLSVSEAGGAGSNVLYEIYNNSTPHPQCIVKRKYANNDVCSTAGSCIITIADGDVIFLTANSSGTNNITCQYGNLNLTRI